MNDVLTIDEMKARYDGEWVLVEDPELDEHLRVLRGKVINHSVNRDDVYQNVGAKQARHTASLCFKKTPADTVYVL